MSIYTDSTGRGLECTECDALFLPQLDESNADYQAAKQRFREKHENCCLGVCGGCGAYGQYGEPHFRRCYAENGQMEECGQFV